MSHFGEHPAYYAVITADILFNPLISDSEKIMLAHISVLQKKDKWCRASNSYFGKVCDKHKNTAGKIINSLQEKGFIESRYCYKKGTKEIEKRLIKIADNIPGVDTPLNETVEPPLNETVEHPLNETVEHPLNETVEENNTSINNTSINIVKTELLPKKQPNNLPEKTTANTQNKVPFQQIVDLYHELLPELPKVYKLTDQRKGFIRQRWLEDLKDLSNWINFFNHVKTCDFIMGRSAPTVQYPKPFRADLEWLTRPNNFTKIAEDKYA